MPKSKHQWKVWVEVELHVEAFDAVSAEKKAHKAFNSKRALAPDVTLNGGEVIVYQAEAAQAVA